jgi:hypothetical protein
MSLLPDWLSEVGGNPSLEGMQRQQGALQPGWANGRVQGCEQCFLREERDLLERTALNQLGQDGSGRATDDTAISTKPHRRDRLIRTDV